MQNIVLTRGTDKLKKIHTLPMVNPYTGKPMNNQLNPRHSISLRNIEDMLDCDDDTLNKDFENAWLTDEGVTTLFFTLASLLPCVIGENEWKLLLEQEDVCDYAGRLCTMSDMSFCLVNTYNNIDKAKAMATGKHTRLEYAALANKKGPYAKKLHDKDVAAAVLHQDRFDRYADANGKPEKVPALERKDRSEAALGAVKPSIYQPQGNPKAQEDMAALYRNTKLNLTRFIVQFNDENMNARPNGIPFWECLLNYSRLLAALNTTLAEEKMAAKATRDAEENKRLQDSIMLEDCFDNPDALSRVKRAFEKKEQERQKKKMKKSGKK